MEWPEVLDAMEERNAVVDHILHFGGPALEPFSTPADLGPLPAELRERAEGIQRETDRLIKDVARARDLVADALCRPPGRPERSPIFIDARV